MEHTAWPTIVISALVGSGAALAAVALTLAWVAPRAMESSAPTAADSSLPGAQELLNPHQQAQEIAAWRDARLREFNAERPLPGWSTNAQNQLEAHLEQLRQARSDQDLDVFDVVKVECHTSLCIASLAWDHIAYAREASTSLAGCNYRLPCATSSLVYDRPGEVSVGRYRHELIFHCDAMRTG